LENLRSAVSSSGTHVHEEVTHAKVAARILPEQEKSKGLVDLGADGLLRIGVLGPRMKVVTQSGTTVGWINRYVIEQDSGSLIGYEVGRTEMPESVPPGSIIPVSAVLALTQDALLVPNEIRSKLVATSLVAGEEPPPSPAPSSVQVDDKPMALDAKKRQMQYIVGKIAGRDLVASDGTLIIAEGTPISKEVVEQAREAGLLPELIVHMTLPKTHAIKAESS